MKTFFYNLVVRRMLAIFSGLLQGINDRSFKTYDVVFERDQYEQKSILVGWGMILAWLLSSLAFGILSAWPHMSLEALAIGTGIASLLTPFLVYPFYIVIGGEILMKAEPVETSSPEKIRETPTLIQAKIKVPAPAKTGNPVAMTHYSLDAAGRPSYGNPGRGIINYGDY